VFFPENSRQPQPLAQPFSRHGKAGCCRKEKTRHRFAFGSPQDRRMQLMLRPGPVRATELKRLTRLRILREAALRSDRAAREHA
jgi:hypothetical protein